jgi:hypothetical protein
LSIKYLGVDPNIEENNWFKVLIYHRKSKDLSFWLSFFWKSKQLF